MTGRRRGRWPIGASVGDEHAHPGSRYMTDSSPSAATSVLGSPATRQSESLIVPDRKPAPRQNIDNPEQSRRFIDMARELEADEPPSALHRAFDKIIRTKRPPESSKTH